MSATGKPTENKPPVLWSDSFDRRDFLKFLGASTLIAGVSACVRSPLETIVPFVRAPENVVPGSPLYFATAIPRAGFGVGVLIESHMGRPTKVEGNPLHPASLGGADAITQSSILSLYDPDRSSATVRKTQDGGNGSQESFEALLSSLTDAMLKSGGERARIGVLTGTVTSPTTRALLSELRRKFPNTRWAQYEPFGRESVVEGAKLAFRANVEPLHHLDKVTALVSLDADVLFSEPSAVRNARHFVATRKGESTPGLYVAEATFSLTGARASSRLPVRPSEMAAIARAFGLAAAGATSATDLKLPEAQARWVLAASEALTRNRGRSLLIAGENLPPEAHALCHAINERNGNAGKTYSLIDRVDEASETVPAATLIREMRRGAIDVLLVFGANPALSAPPDLEFVQALEKVPFSLHLGLYRDETGSRCAWHVPELHYLESWGDLRACDGTASIVQPLIAPLFGGHSALELLSFLARGRAGNPHDLVREFWSGRTSRIDFETSWRDWLEKGLIPSTAFQPRKVTAEKLETAIGRIPAVSQPPSSGQTLEIAFRPDPTVGDGSFANNAWLQELPKPITQLTWDNAVLINPATASALELENETVVELKTATGLIRGPVLHVRGIPHGTATLHAGYGRTGAGRFANGQGFNAYLLRSSETPFHVTQARLTKTTARYPLAIAQRAELAPGKHPPVRHGATQKSAPLPSLYPWQPDGEHAWAMVIDLEACIGCGACVVACQAENSVPVVGKHQVRLGREMHWIRIDRYFTDKSKDKQDRPETSFQPVPCMHCENAPCELVCPVAATVHDAEGLNEMLYHRCVGTRYCSNNCPYKVRRFNFYQYVEENSELLKMQRNPDVTVRSRGVMEKCTYCVQRINAEKRSARIEKRTVREENIVPACAATCPTTAIHFGDLNAPESRIRKLRESPFHYALLEELGTRPRTTYLAKREHTGAELPDGREQ